MCITHGLTVDQEIKSTMQTTSSYYCLQRHSCAAYKLTNSRENESLYSTLLLKVKRSTHHQLGLYKIQKTHANALNENCLGCNSSVSMCAVFLLHAQLVLFCSQEGERRAFTGQTTSGLGSECSN